MLDDLKQAIDASDFDRFFGVLSQPHAKYDYEVFKQIEEAVKVAELQQNTKALKKIAKLKLDAWQGKTIFSAVIKSLITLGKTDIATSVVTYNEVIDKNEAWLALVTPLIENNKFSKAKKVLPNLCIDYHYKAIVTKCLDKIDVERNPEEWLNWFEIFLQDGCDFYNSSDYINKAIPIILDYTPFEEMCQRLGKWSDSTHKNTLLTRLCAQLVLNEKYEMSQQVEAVLPENLTWLKQARLAVDDEAHFNVFHEQSGIREVRQKALEQFFERNMQEDNDKLLQKIEVLVGVDNYSGLESSIIKIVIDRRRIDLAFILIEKYKPYNSQDLIFAIAGNKALTSAQIDTLLSAIEKPGARSWNNYDRVRFDRVRLELVTKQKLSKKQYRRVIKSLQRVEEAAVARIFDCTEKSIIELIPADIVDDERRGRQLLAERKQRETTQALMSAAETEFHKSVNIHRKHPQYHQLVRSIEQLLEIKNFEPAIKLIKKMVCSRYRDTLVRTVLKKTLALGQYQRSKEAAELFSKSEKNKGKIIGFIKQYIANNLKAAFKALLALEGYRAKLLDCVVKILGATHIQNPTEFFIQHGVFALSSLTYCGTNDSDLILRIKQCVAQRIYDEAKTPKQLHQRVGRLKKRGIKGFEVPLLDVLLLDDKLDDAIQLANLPTENDGWEMTKRLKKHYKTMTATPVLMKSLAAIASPHRQSVIAEVLLGKDKRPPVQSTIDLLAAIPCESLRDKKLVALIVEDMMGINSQPVQLVSPSAANHLSQKLKPLWQDIIECISTKHYGQAFNLLHKHCVDVDYNFKHWLLERWTDTEPVSAVFEMAVVPLYERMVKVEHDRDVARKQSDQEACVGSDSYEERWRTHYELINKHNLLDSFFAQSYNHWVKAVENTREYKVIVNGIIQLLKLSTSLITKANNLFSTLYDIASKVCDAGDYTYLLEVVRLIQQHEKAIVCDDVDDDYYDSYDRLENRIPSLCYKLLQENQLPTVASLLAFLEEGSHQREQITIELANRYLKNNDFKSFRLLFNGLHKDTYTFRCPLVQWTLKLIEKNEIELAEHLVARLNAGESSYVNIIEKLLEYGKIFIARGYIKDKIKTPSIKLRLKTQLQESYFKQLGTMLEESMLESFREIHLKAIKILRCLKDGENEVKANRLQNEVVVEAQSFLERAFRSFYVSHYGEIKSRLYFPINLQLGKQTVTGRLTYIFSKILENPAFAKDHPKVFALLQEIELKKETEYAWLKQFVLSANTQKHERVLPLNPKVREYLPAMLDGIVQILLLLFKPALSKDQVQELTFTHYCDVTNENVVVDVEETIVTPCAPAGSALEAAIGGAGASAGSALDAATGGAGAAASARFFSAASSSQMRDRSGNISASGEAVEQALRSESFFNYLQEHDIISEDIAHNSIIEYLDGYAADPRIQSAHLKYLAYNKSMLCGA